MITILYEKTLNKSMIDKRVDEKESEGLKKIYNHYSDKRKDTMKSTEIPYHELSVDILGEDGITSDQTTEHKILLAKLL